MADLALIKRLRESTGCGIADCNKALKENGDDYDKSVDWLRKKGLSSASKKSGRVTSEGVVAVANADNKASVIEVNSETDFVARNQKFQDLVSKLSVEALEFGDDFDKFQAAKDSEVKAQIGVMAKNINLRRIASLNVSKGVVASYIHNLVAKDMGKIAVLVALESEAEKEKLEELGKQIAMHIAAARPESLNIDGS